MRKSTRKSYRLSASGFQLRTSTRVITVVINRLPATRGTVATELFFTGLHTTMHARANFSITLLTLLLIGNVCHGQSLGDIARQNQKDKQKKGSPNKVVTTDDLSPSGAPNPAPASAADTKKTNQPPTYDKLGYASFTPEMWTRTIKAQKDWVAYLQKEADKLKTPPKFDQKKAATDPEAKKYWEECSIQQQYASQIPEQQEKLKDIQFEAQKAGMPSSVWDPQ
jgi:hypothetical protein